LSHAGNESRRPILGTNGQSHRPEMQGTEKRTKELSYATINASLLFALRAIVGYAVINYVDICLPAFAFLDKRFKVKQITRTK